MLHTNLQEGAAQTLGIQVLLKAHPSTADTIEAHYPDLERLRAHGCYDGLVYIGYWPLVRRLATR